MGGQSTVVVRGSSLLAPPLLVTREANTIEFRDGFGELNALLVRMFGDSEMWGLVTKRDEDWPETLLRYGYVDVQQPAADVIRGPLAAGA